MATLTVREPGWNRYSGQRSRVPPARSARTGARTMTLFICGTPILLEECPLLRRLFSDGSARWEVEARHQSRHVRAVARELRAAQRIGRDRFQIEGIEPLAALGHAIVEMWT